MAAAAVVGPEKDDDVADVVEIDIDVVVVVGFFVNVHDDDDDVVSSLFVWMTYCQNHRLDSCCRCL